MRKEEVTEKYERTRRSGRGSVPTRSRRSTSRNPPSAAKSLPSLQTRTFHHVHLPTCECEEPVVSGAASVDSIRSASGRGRLTSGTRAAAWPALTVSNTWILISQLHPRARSLGRRSSPPTPSRPPRPWCPLRLRVPPQPPRTSCPIRLPWILDSGWTVDTRRAGGRWTVSP